MSGELATMKKRTPRVNQMTALKRLKCQWLLKSEKGVC